MLRENVSSIMLVISAWAGITNAAAEDNFRELRFCVEPSGSKTETNPELRTRINKCQAIWDYFDPNECVKKADAQVQEAQYLYEPLASKSQRLRQRFETQKAHLAKIRAQEATQLEYHRDYQPSEGNLDAWQLEHQTRMNQIRTEEKGARDNVVQTAQDLDEADRQTRIARKKVLEAKEEYKICSRKKKIREAAEDNKVKAMSKLRWREDAENQSNLMIRFGGKAAAGNCPAQAAAYHGVLKEWPSLGAQNLCRGRDRNAGAGQSDALSRPTSLSTEQ
jgi:NADH dehydrogenase/NADH:ubiquinone oxidoreductase subunit G